MAHRTSKDALSQTLASATTRFIPDDLDLSDYLYRLKTIPSLVVSRHIRILSHAFLHFPLVFDVTWFYFWLFQTVCRPGRSS
jgi:hypothetical protein